MYILGFETTGPIGSVALMNLDSGEIKIKETTEALSHLKNAASLAEELLIAEGIKPDRMSEIAAVAASVGPGSFTGIRIGVTMARSLAMALGVPTISVPSLEVFREKCEGIPAAAILNARRGQVYGAVFDGEGNTLLEPGPYMLEDVLGITLKLEKTIFYGDGIDAYEDRILEAYVCDGNASEDGAGDRVVFSPVYNRYQKADSIVLIGGRKFAEGDTLDAEELLPEYMRLAEAEQKLNDGTLERQRKAKLLKAFNG